MPCALVLSCDVSLLLGPHELSVTADWSIVILAAHCRDCRRLRAPCFRLLSFGSVSLCSVLASPFFRWSAASASEPESDVNGAKGAYRSFCMRVRDWNSYV